MSFEIWRKRLPTDQPSDRRQRYLPSKKKHPKDWPESSLNRWFKRWSDRRSENGCDCNLPRALAFSGAATALTVVFAQLGYFEQNEVKFFDLLTQITASSQQRPSQDPDASNQPGSASTRASIRDSRIVVVGITEEDIQAQKQWPLSDQVFAQLLAKLQAHSPQVIGLDIYRDLLLEPGTQALAKQLQRENVITIIKLDNLGNVEVPAPLKVPDSRVGFVDFVIDPDGVIRRNFMFAVTADNQQLYSFSLRVAEQFLATKGLTVTPTEDAITIGDTRIESIKPHAGGYQMIDAAGYQTLMRYFSPTDRLPQLTLTQVLSGDFDPALIKGKIVLIGTTAPSQKDLFYTPFSSIKANDLLSPGVIVHAQMTRQLLSAVLDERSLLSVWPQWGEWVWVGLWGLAGGLIGWRFAHPRTLAIATTIALSGLTATTVVLFAQAVWLPYILPIVNFGLASTFLILYKEFRKTFYDAITGLPNRTLLTQKLETLLKQSHQTTTAVMLLDIDQFKVFNENFGLKTGDRLLQIVAKRIEQNLPRKTTTVARIAGDEFVILLKNLTQKEEALALADQLSQKMAEPINLIDHKLENQKIFVTVSLGIAFSAFGSEPTAADQKISPAINAENLLRDAQTALSRAKASGKRGQREVFANEMRTQLSNRMWIESDLREALTRNEFLVYYQPLICLKTMTIAGFEALIRWQHAEKGMIFPGDFIAIAEDTGLIIPIGQWVLETACQQTQQWRQQFPENPPFISVNLSGRQFAQPDLVEQIDRILTETGLEPSVLKLELTESVVMDNLEESIAVLRRLKGLRLKLGIDDFGTGYSSLSYLHRFPIDTLKVDRSFVMGMEAPDGTAELVKTIISLGHNLGMNVIAEGIETHSQSQKLQALQCEYGQGYLFAKPLPAQAAEALLAEQTHWRS